MDNTSYRIKVFAKIKDRTEQEEFDYSSGRIDPLAIERELRIIEVYNNPSYSRLCLECRQNHDLKPNTRCLKSFSFKLQMGCDEGQNENPLRVQQNQHSTILILSNILLRHSVELGVLMKFRIRKDEYTGQKGILMENVGFEVGGVEQMKKDAR
jgi:hypothetical protein